MPDLQFGAARDERWATARYTVRTRRTRSETTRHAAKAWDLPEALNSSSEGVPECQIMQGVSEQPKEEIDVRLHH